MQSKLTLFNLFESCPYTSSHIVYCDGVKRHSITFNELRNRVFYVSKQLESLSPIICNFIKPSLALPAIILGILKVSSTFAFLDTYRPFDSLLAFQKVLNVKTLLVEECYLKNFEPKLCHCWKRTKQFNLYSDFVILQSTKCKNDACPNSKEYKVNIWQHEIAYAIQTSGTTGEPKVVQVPHDCIVSNIIDFRSRFSITANDVILQSTRITFDPSIIEIFLSLTSGAELIIIADHIRCVPEKLIDIVFSNNVTVLQGTPSLICNFGEKNLKEILLRKQSNLRILAFGGEICPSVSKLKRWKCEENKTEIYNLYGLTEVSCWASCFKIDFSNSLSTIPIGEPLLHTEFKIFNENGDIADRGELYIGGSKRFCIINNEEWPENHDTFMRPSGDIVLKTGDFIYFEGRNNSIIKYMGHKISLQLVNSVIETFPEVASHFLHFDHPSSKLLLFMVWSCDNCDKSEIECRLLKHLKNVIPNLPVLLIVSVPFIPVTKHGKVDSEKLMNLISSKKEKIFCKDNTWENCVDVISNLWKKYTTQINLIENDNFVLNGGNSISAIQLASEIEWHFQLFLPLLVEKILNECFNDICNYVKSCLYHNQQSVPFHEDCSNFIESSTSQPLIKKKCVYKSRCFKVCYKQGCCEFCIHAADSKGCFSRKSESYQNAELHLKLSFKWDLKKCIDSTPTILYLPLSDQLLLFIGSHFGMFSCIDISKRVEKWQVLVPDRIESSACISACGNYVLFGCYDNHLYCISIANGHIQWKHKTDAEVKSSPCVSKNNTSFVGSHDKHVYAIDVESGLVLWKKKVSFGSIFSSPAVIENLLAICVGTLDGVLALLKMENGDILWKHYSGKPLFASPLVTSNFILIGSTDNCVLCLDFNGKLEFKYSTAGPVFSSSVYDKELHKNQVIFGCHDSYLHCITLSGDLVWKTLCDSVVYATPCIFKWCNYYYVCAASSKGTIYILQFSDGKLLFSWKCPGEIFSSPIILNDILVIGCRDNNVYCFNLVNFIEYVE